MALAIVALAVFAYTLLLQIKDLKVFVKTLRIRDLGYMERFESLEGKLDRIDYLEENDVNHTAVLNSLIKLHSIDELTSVNLIK